MALVQMVAKDILVGLLHIFEITGIQHHFMALRLGHRAQVALVTLQIGEHLLQAAAIVLANMAEPELSSSTHINNLQRITYDTTSTYKFK
jgi:hypothetical protein